MWRFCDRLFTQWLLCEMAIQNTCLTQCHYGKNLQKNQTAKYAILRERFLPNLALRQNWPFFLIFFFKLAMKAQIWTWGQIWPFFFFFIGYLNLGFCHSDTVANTYVGGFLLQVFATVLLWQSGNTEYLFATVSLWQKPTTESNGQICHLRFLPQ